MEGTVFDIQRFSVHDGPGIRTTVFLKGCPLRCAWCHNPESQTATPSLAFYPNKCVNCGACKQACPTQAHRFFETGKHQIRRDSCNNCGACAKACVFGALEHLGKKESVSAILSEVLRDKSFYKNSGGGLTVSGGEPLMQGEFLTELLKRAKEEGLHTCIETSGFGKKRILTEIAKYIDLFLFDIKETDEEMHQKYIGVPFAPIRNNLFLLDSLGAKIVLRCPLIPGINVREEHFEAIARLASEAENVQEINVMAYHILGNAKYDALNLENPMMDQAAMTSKEKTACIEAIREKIRNIGTREIKVC